MSVDALCELDPENNPSTRTANTSFFFLVKTSDACAHLLRGNGEAKYWLEPAIDLAVNYGLNGKELGDIERILGERKDEIIERWKQHHGTR